MASEERQKRIEIVSHCWAGRYGHYARCLAYQLSSLLINPPQHCHVTFTVCYEPTDVPTMRVMQQFIEVKDSFPEDDDRHSNICFASWGLPIEQLGRRAIGRNLAAKHSVADLVWFTDCDHLFCDGILDRLVAMEWPEGASMIYPREIMIHRDHATGDAVLNQMPIPPRMMDTDLSLFIPKRYNRAIGGVQIVQGDDAREFGYLADDDGWQEPLKRKTFVSCRCDQAYRNKCKQRGPIVAVDLLGVYRIRHTQTTHHDR
jgi:hypothetical protein